MHHGMYHTTDIAQNTVPTGVQTSVFYPPCVCDCQMIGGGGGQLQLLVFDVALLVDL